MMLCTGDLDLLAGDTRFLEAVYYFENTGNATVSVFYESICELNVDKYTGNRWLFRSYPRLFMADMNGDNIDDLLISHGDGKIFLCYNDGSSVSDPHFTQVPDGSDPLKSFSFVNPHAMAVDVDSDGDFDLVVLDFDGLVHVLENVGSSTSPSFTLQSATVAVTRDIQVGQLPNGAVGDIDGDGRR
jgi:hypothetical protein